MRGHMTH